MHFKLFILSLVAVTVSIAGCGHNHESEIHSEAGEVKIQFTSYTDDFELFAEADPFVAGQTSNVLSHFTSLPGFTPLAKGAVTLKINIGGQTAEQTLEGPVHEGVYSFDLTPVTSGAATLEYLIRTDSGDYTVVVPDVVVYPTAVEANEAAGKDVVPHANTTVFTKDQAWKTEFATGYPVRKFFGQVIKTVAQVSSAPADEVVVTARTSGEILLTENNIVEGMKVSAGQTLLAIRGSSLAENNTAVRFAEARNNYEKARTDYERTKLLAADKIVSEKQLLEATTTYENARAVYDNLNQNFTAAGQLVTSPMTGFIKQVHVKNGQYAGEGQILITISQNKSLLLQAGVQQKYAPLLRSTTDANIRTPGDNTTFTLEELNGTILSVGKTTSPDNFLVPVTLQIDNNGGFIPGGFVELYLKTHTDNQALIVPNTALVEEQGNFFVFVQATPELFEKREVKPGVTDGNDTEIREGLTGSERIVTKGAILIRLSQATGALDAHSGHVH